MIQDSSNHGCIRGTGKSFPRVDSPVLLMHYDPSDPGSLIAIQILPSDVINVSGVAIPRGNEFRKIERF